MLLRKFVLCLFLSAAALGCNDRVHTFVTPGTSPNDDGGGGTGGGTGGRDGGGQPADVPTAEVQPPRDTGPMVDMRVPVPCTPPGTKEVCNDRDDDCNGMIDDVAPAELQSNALQCGKCSVVCNAGTNAIAKCTAGACGYECQPGAIDIDKGSANGCECLVTNSGTEICDDRDNDCNGTVDDGFDLQKSTEHCGTCNKRCIFAFAEATCVAGACAMGACRMGFFDRDNDPRNGCESACQPSNGGVEACNGVDDDCDGMIDEGALTPPTGFVCKAMGVCAGSTPQCRDLGAGVKGWDCGYSADYEEAETVTKGCDGKDNDCDGAVDEPFGVGRACTVGMGGCANAGTLICDPADKTKTACNAMPKAGTMEICNGVDDDCDGKVDELASLADRTADDKLVYLAGSDVTMFAYEASRADATNATAGMDSTLRPCSLAARLPWSNVTKEEARDMCKAIGTGWRLCTKDEWFAGCSKAGANVYPYGATYDGTKCNGADFAKGAGVTTIPVGSAGQCRADQTSAADDELFDMSGNVREWVLTTQSPEAFELRGGAYNVESFGGDAPGLRCEASIPAPTAAVRLPSVGFRCCRAGRLQ